jgi:microcystin-dependent protein
MMYGAPTAPGGWLVCDGAAVSRTQYSALFAIISTNYGPGDGSSTFNLPDLQGRFALGTSATYPTGSSGGEAAHALTVAELATHAHVLTDPGHTHPDPSHTHGASTGSHGHTAHDSGHVHGVVNPTGALNAQPGSGMYSASGSMNTNTGFAQIVIDAVGNIGVTVNAAVTGLGSQRTGATVNDTGSGASHNNMPPYQTVNYIIKT